MVPRIGCMIWDGNYSPKSDDRFRYGKLLHHFEYNWVEPEKENIVVFSDLAIPCAAHKKFRSVKHRVAWLMESPAIYATWGHFIGNMKWLLANLDIFTAVATCDDSLVAAYPDKMVFVPFGGIIVSEEDARLYEKAKLCSMTSGTLWSPRDIIYAKYKDSGMVDFLGKSFNRPYASIVEGFRDYRYHISVSSCCEDRFFSSNLTDPLACGTVPIWRGCDKLSEFFNMDGIITFRTMEELEVIMAMIGEDDYNSRLPAIIENQQFVEKYRTPENALWNNLLEKLYN